jgi:hypothetical protein
MGVVAQFTLSSPRDSPAVPCPLLIAVRWLRLTGDEILQSREFRT